MGALVGPPRQPSGLRAFGFGPPRTSTQAWAVARAEPVPSRAGRDRADEDVAPFPRRVYPPSRGTDGALETPPARGGAPPPPGGAGAWGWGAVLGLSVRGEFRIVLSVRSHSHVRARRVLRGRLRLVGRVRVYVGGRRVWADIFGAGRVGWIVDSHASVLLRVRNGVHMGVQRCFRGSTVVLLWVCFGFALGLLWVCFGFALGLLSS